jgi:hypothetical protein
MRLFKSNTRSVVRIPCGLPYPGNPEWLAWDVETDTRFKSFGVLQLGASWFVVHLPSGRMAGVAKSVKYAWAMCRALSDIGGGDGSDQEHPPTWWLREASACVMQMQLQQGISTEQWADIP